MKNILSYTSPVKGFDIKYWILYHTTYKTSHSKMAKKLVRYLSLKDETLYEVVFIHESKYTIGHGLPMFCKV